jgi:hypothetical protein
MSQDASNAIAVVLRNMVDDLLPLPYRLRHAIRADQTIEIQIDLQSPTALVRLGNQ